MLILATSTQASTRRIRQMSPTGQEGGGWKEEETSGSTGEERFAFQNTFIDPLPDQKHNKNRQHETRNSK